MKVGIIKSQVPLRMESAPQRFKYRGLGGVTAADQAENIAGRRSPIEFADTPEVPDR
jgi:hypothetical protein